MFRWACLAAAAATILGFGWVVNDLRLDIKSSTQTVREKLPEILEKTRKTSEVLAELAEDVKQLRQLAGVSGGARDKSLVVFAGGVLDDIEATEGRIGLKKKVFGSGLKEVVSAREWAAGARKEALWQTFHARSKAELLTGLCENLFGSRWWLQLGEGEPVELLEWVKSRHPEAKEGE
ncbi:MAG: hypothetical protein HYZ53_04955 [Planctomycetes bacterium]|nr:hypothetical protein [Planctomycetota bacterium]